MLLVFNNSLLDSLTRTKHEVRFFFLCWSTSQADRTFVTLDKQSTLSGHQCLHLFNGEIITIILPLVASPTPIPTPLWSFNASIASSRKPPISPKSALFQQVVTVYLQQTTSSLRTVALVA